MEHLHVLTMVTDYVMMMLNYCLPNADYFACAHFVTLVISQRS